jgi:outer membrane biosynthesis protein TonB
VAKKAQKRAATKKVVSKPAKVAPRSAGKPAIKSTAQAKPSKAAKPAVSTGRAAAVPSGRALGEQAAQLRDDILRSKLTHPDPWRYAGKARGWGERAQALVDQTAVDSHAAGAQRAFEALASEVQADRDFQEARRLF